MPILRRRVLLTAMLSLVVLLVFVIAKAAKWPSSREQPVAPTLDAKVTSRTTGIAAPLIAPFSGEQAKTSQADWAKHLGVPIEWTNSVGMTFVLIPPGEYTRGSSPEVVARFQEFFPEDGYFQTCLRSQSPAHLVILTRPLYVGTHEVTQKNFSDVLGRNPSSFSVNGAMRQTVARQDTSQLPVETVSWLEAVEFCRKLSEREERPLSGLEADGSLKTDGADYRLPTEAEWEFACRAGTETLFWTGDEVDDNLRQAAWVSASLTSESGGRDPPHAVGQLQPNPFGLFDTHGNVWEWCHDWFAADTYAQFAQTPAINPTGPDRIATDAFASEQASRLVAMDGATRNTERLLQSLTDLQQRERQDEITREILELISARVVLE